MQNNIYGKKGKINSLSRNVVLTSFVFSLLTFEAFAIKASRAPKYGYINMMRIMEEIPEVKIAEKKFQSAVEGKREEIQKKIAQFEVERKKYEDSKVSPVEQSASKNKMESLIKEIEKMQQNHQLDIYKLRVKILKPTMDDLAKVSDMLCKEIGVDLLERIETPKYLYMNKDFDYTDIFVKKVKQFYHKK